MRIIETRLERQARLKHMSLKQYLEWLFTKHYTATDAAVAAGVSRHTFNKAMQQEGVRSPYKRRKAQS